MSRSPLSFHASSPEATCAFAEALGARLAPGDAVLLTGPVGAGKSHFARCLIAALLTAPEDIPSPTFTLVQSYAGRSGEIWHADLYRLADSSEIAELGLEEAFDTAICLVEWPDRLGDAAPVDALAIRFAPGPGESDRELTLTWEDPRWAARLEGLAERVHG